MCCCCLRYSRGVSYALCEKREAHGPFWSVGFLGYLWGGSGWVRASPELLGVVGLSPSRRGGYRCVVFCGNARLEVASPPRVRPAIVYTVYTIHLPTFPIREMTNCVSAAVAGGGGEGGGGKVICRGTCLSLSAFDCVICREGYVREPIMFVSNLCTENLGKQFLVRLYT